MSSKSSNKIFDYKQAYESSEDESESESEEETDEESDKEKEEEETDPEKLKKKLKKHIKKICKKESSVTKCTKLALRAFGRAISPMFNDALRIILKASDFSSLNYFSSVLKNMPSKKFACFMAFGFTEYCEDIENFIESSQNQVVEEFFEMLVTVIEKEKKKTEYNTVQKSTQEIFIEILETIKLTKKQKKVLAILIVDMVEMWQRTYKVLKSIGFKGFNKSIYDTEYVDVVYDKKKKDIEVYAKTVEKYYAEER